jgi:hypothetical protein
LLKSALPRHTFSFAPCEDVSTQEFYSSMLGSLQ